MRVWITRTEPGAARQARDLSSAGYQVVVEPVLCVEPTGAALPTGSADVVLFLSEHGVATCASFEFCTGARVYAVGSRTAAALEARGISALVPEDERSEGLLQMPELSELREQRLLLVAGEGGRELLTSAFTARGARVDEYRCYRRVQRSDMVVPAGRVDVIVAASGDGAAAVAQLWFRERGAADVVVLVPSARVGNIARAGGFQRVIECAGASSRAILTALQQISVT